MTFFVLFPERKTPPPQPPTFFTARSLKIEQGLPKNLVWKKTTWVLITVTYIFKIYDDIYDAFGGKILKKAAKLTILAGKY